MASVIRKFSWLVLGGLSLSVQGTIAIAQQVQVSPERSPEAMVTSAHPLATDVGLQILKQGGNAVDAAVATTFAISVVEPFSAGIGGGGFLLHHQEQSGAIEALDFRERAPAKATETLYQDEQGNVKPGLSVNGHLAVAVPGTVAGLAEVHRRHGVLPWADLVQPAITLAEQGFPVSQRFAQRLERRKTVLLQNEAARDIFSRDGATLQVGDPFVQADLAQTLRAIARNPDSFYRGKIARAIARDMKKHNGLITRADLQQYQPTWRTPLCGEFQVWEVCSMPPPSSGGLHLLQLLNFWQLQLWEQPRFDPDTLHLMAETMKIAYADRAVYLGDPDVVSVPVNSLTALEYARRRVQGLDLDQARSSDQVFAADRALLQRIRSILESLDTSHLTVVDRDRNAVSLTFTVNLSFGAGVVAKGTGIVLNNEMDDFSSAPGQPNAFGLVGSQANAIAPGKVPLSSMTPTIVRELPQVFSLNALSAPPSQTLSSNSRPPNSRPPNSRPPNSRKFRLAVGAPGGSTIITTVYQILLNTLVYDMDAAEAVAAPRIHHQWLPDQLRVERDRLPPETLKVLQERGHPVTVRSPWGNANLIQRLPDGQLEGAADPRGEGTAAGY